MSAPRISLEQWRALTSVVESGGYAQAAEALHKSQSTITYAVQRIEALLGVQAFEIQGRKAVLTAAGQVLYRRGKSLVDEATRLERAAAQLATGWEAELRIAVDASFPTWLLLDCFAKFGRERPETHIELYEAVLSGTDEALLEGQVDLAIGSSVPAGFVGEALMRVRFVPAAAPDHPLHRLGRPLTRDDLRTHRRLIVRDTGAQRARGTPWQGEPRWTVSNKATSIRAAVQGEGYAWYAEDIIRPELSAGTLKQLPLRDGGERWTTLYLLFADPDAAGPGARRLAEIIRAEVSSRCSK
jgi:DNA-binding transcriptional LysR family regulator